MPITARPAMTSATPDASAHNSDPTQKIATPASMTRLRPSRSPSEPPTSIRLANTSA